MTKKSAVHKRKHANSNIKTTYYEMNSLLTKLCIIHTKQDLLLLLLETIIQLNNADMLKINEHAENSFLITFGDMKRVFFKIGDTKISSFVFPFGIQPTNDHQYRIYDTDIDFTISARITSILKQIISSNAFNNLDHNTDSIEELLSEALNLPTLQNSTDSSDILFVLQKLLLFEPGYIRYDYDVEHQNGKRHPLQHFDVNYSNLATFKLGLERKNKVEQIIEFMDKKTDAYFLKK